MNKHVLLPLIVLLTLILTACGAGGQQPPATPDTPPTAVVAETEPTVASQPPTATVAPSSTPTPPPTETPEPEIETIAYGDAIRGTLEEENGEVTYLIEGSEGDTVYITVETVRGRMEPSLTLFDSEDNELAESEPTGEFTAALSYELEEDGEYRLAVSGEGDDSGAFELMVQNAQVGGALEYEEPVTGIFTGDESEAEWTFEADAGDFVDIEIRGNNDLDTRIELLDPGGEFVAYSDDSETLDPRLIGVPLLTEGEYTLRVYPVSEEPQGSYELELRQAEAVGGEVTPGEAVSGELAAQGSQLWTFEGAEGDEISIAVDAAEDSGVDPYVVLYDPEGVRLASDDDSGEERNALIRKVVLPASGTYNIVISRLGGEGAFTLLVDTPREPTAAGTLNDGETVQGELTGSEEESWLFTAQAGDIVTITVNSLDSSALDIKVALRDESEEQLTSDDDSGEDNNALISGYPIAADGTYTVIVSAFRGEGAYEVTITRSAAPPITIGETIQGEIVDGASQLWIFEGTAGATVSLSAVAAPEAERLDLQLTLISPEGEEIAFDDDGGEETNPLIEEITLPMDGAYMVVVTVFSGEGAFELTLTAVE